MRVVFLETKVPAGDRPCTHVDSSKHDLGLFSQEECQTMGFLPLPSLSKAVFVTSFCLIKM